MRKGTESAENSDSKRNESGMHDLDNDHRGIHGLLLWSSSPLFDQPAYQAKGGGLITAALKLVRDSLHPENLQDIVSCRGKKQNGHTDGEINLKQRKQCFAIMREICGKRNH